MATPAVLALLVSPASALFMGINWSPENKDDSAHLRWEDCSDGSYVGTFVDMHTTFTETGAPTEPALSIPLETNVSLVSVAELLAPIPAGSMYRSLVEISNGFSFNTEGSMCHPMETAYPFDLGRSYARGLSCPTNDGLLISTGTVYTPRIPSALQPDWIRTTTTTSSPSGDKLLCMIMTIYKTRPD